MARKKLGEILIEEGVLDESRLRAALIEQQRWGGPLGRLLVEMRLVEEHAMVGALSRQLHVPTVDLDSIEVPQAVLDLVPGELAEQHSVMPFAQPMKFLDLAMTDPTQLGIIDELQIRTRLNVRAFLAGPKAVERALSRYYGRGYGQAFRQPGRQTRASEPIPLDTGGERGMEIERTPTMDVGVARQTERMAMPPALSTPVHLDRSAEIEALQRRVSKLEALIARDENVLRKVLALLVEKGVASREEIVERLK
jgi:type IV pilus assembly protein PilB